MNKPKLYLGGHRGCGCTDHEYTLKQHPQRKIPTENTLESIKRAFSIGSDFVEIDIITTKDAVPLCVHNVRPEDHFFKSKPGEYLNLLTYDQIKRYKTGRKGQGNIAKLEEVLELTEVQDSNLSSCPFKLNIELKGVQSSNQQYDGESLIAPIAKTISKSKIKEERILFSSFCLENIIQMSQLLPNAQYGMLFCEDKGGKPLYKNLQNSMLHRSLEFNIKNIEAVFEHCQTKTNLKYLHPEINSALLNNENRLERIITTLKTYQYQLGINAWSLYEEKESKLPNPLKKLLRENISTGFITDFIEHYKKLARN